MALVDTIIINGVVVDAAGDAITGATCTFNVICPPSFSGDYAISVTSMDATTDENGEFTINLIKGVIYKASIEAVGLVRTFTAPLDGTSANLFDLVTA